MNTSKASLTLRALSAVFFAIAAAALLGGCVSFGRASGAARKPEVRGVGMTGMIPTAGTTFAGSQRVLVRSAAGTLYLAYIKNIAGVGQVYVTRSTDDGTSWSDFPQISAGQTSSSNPDLVIDSRGDLRVFWTKHETTPPTGEPSTGWGGRPSAATKRSARAAEEAAAKNGFAKPGQAAGESDGDYGTVRQLFMSSFNGKNWTNQRQLTHGDYNGFPSAAFDSRGVLHMVWYGYDGHNYQVISSRLTGSRWSKPRQISEGFPDSVNPTIAVDREDNLHVAWYKYSPATKSYQIYYRGFSATKRRWSPPDQQISEGLEQAENVSIAVDSEDTVWVVWEGQTKAGAPSGIFVRSLRDGTWSDQRRVSPVGQPASEPSLAAGHHGGVFVFYQDDGDHQIYLARHSAGRWRAPVRLTSGGNNAYPNARWSLYGASGPASQARIDYVWTVLGVNAGNPLGKNGIRFGSLQLR